MPPIVIHSSLRLMRNIKRICQALQGPWHGCIPCHSCWKRLTIKWCFATISSAVVPSLGLGMCCWGGSTATHCGPLQLIDTHETTESSFIMDASHVILGCECLAIEGCSTTTKSSVPSLGLGIVINSLFGPIGHIKKIVQHSRSLEMAASYGISFCPQPWAWNLLLRWKQCHPLSPTAHWESWDISKGCVNLSRSFVVASSHIILAAIAPDNQRMFCYRMIIRP